jgi:hypothetical protein
MTRPSAEPAGRRVAAWEGTRRVAARAAHAAPAGRQVEALGSPASGHMVAGRGDAQRRDPAADDRLVVLAGGGLGGLSEDVGRTAAPADMTTAPSRGDRPALPLRCKSTRGHAGCGITRCYPWVSMLILARMPPAPAHPRHGLREALAPLYAGDGSRVDRSCLDSERGLAVSGAAVAPASGGMSRQGSGKRQGRGPEQAPCVHTAGVEGVTRGRGPLRRHESPLV